MDRIATLEVFVKVVDLNGISNAAWSMNIAPGTVSKAVQALEQELNFKLLHRSTKKMSLTEKGKAYYPLAKEIVEKFSQSKLIKDEDSETTGNICINVPNYFSYLYLIEPLAEFLKLYPKIAIELVHTGSVAMISNNEIDLAISNYKIMDKRIHYTPLFSGERVLMASPQYIKHKGMPRSLTDLSNHDCLVNTLLQPENIWHFGKTKVKITPRLSTTDALYLIKAAVADMGILWTSTFFVEEHLQKGELKILSFEYKKSPSHLYLCYPSLPKGNKIRILVDFLNKKLKL